MTRATSVADRAKRVVLAEAENPEALISGEIHDALRELLDRIAQPALCTGCGRAIWFVRHYQTSRLCPYDADGTTHFATCPKAADFRRDPRNGKPVRPPL